MKKIQLIATLALLLSIGLSSCKKEDPEPEPELTETERLLTTKKWKIVETTNYGSYDINTDTLKAFSDTTTITTVNRHMEFQLNGDAGYFDTQADTMTVEYKFSLNEAQTEMRLWEPASVIYWQFYTDYDFVIEALDENNFVVKGDSKRRMIEASYDRYGITKHVFSAL